VHFLHAMTAMIARELTTITIIPKYGVFVPKLGKIYKEQTLFLIMDAEKKILGTFRKSRSALYYSQIKDMTRLSHSSLQNTLAKLEKIHLLAKETTKAHAFYKITKHAYPYFAQLDQESYHLLHRTVILPLEEFLNNSPKSAFFIMLFGSASRGNERKESDIDILVVLHEFKDSVLQEKYDREMRHLFTEAKKKAESISIHPFSLVFAHAKDINNDHLLTQAMQGIPLMNHHHYYEEAYARI